MTLVNVAVCPRRRKEGDIQMAYVKGFNKQMILCGRCLTRNLVTPGSDGVVVEGQCGLENGRVFVAKADEGVIFSSVGLN